MYNLYLAKGKKTTKTKKTKSFLQEWPGFELWWNYPINKETQLNTGRTGAGLVNLPSSSVTYSRISCPATSTKADLTECRSKTDLRTSTYQTWPGEGGDPSQLSPNKREGGAVPAESQARIVFKNKLIPSLQTTYLYVLREHLRQIHALPILWPSAPLSCSGGSPLTFPCSAHKEQKSGV